MAIQTVLLNHYPSSSLMGVLYQEYLGRRRECLTALCLPANSLYAVQVHLCTFNTFVTIETAVRRYYGINMTLELSRRTVFRGSCTCIHLLYVYIQYTSSFTQCW